MGAVGADGFQRTRDLLHNDSSSAKVCRKALLKKRHPSSLSIQMGSGCWRRKTKGQVFCFAEAGHDPKTVAALGEALWVQHELLAGRSPNPKDSDEITVEPVCDAFLEAKENAGLSRPVATGEPMLLEPQVHRADRQQPEADHRVDGEERPVDTRQIVGPNEVVLVGQQRGDRRHTG